jgi:hypothetical protein
MKAKKKMMNRIKNIMNKMNQLWQCSGHTQGVGLVAGGFVAQKVVV